MISKCYDGEGVIREEKRKEWRGLGLLWCRVCI